MRSHRQIILPAEIRSREFDARILQGLLAVQQGWQVVLGSKAMINRNIWRFPRGVYLCQTLTRRRLTMLRLLERLGIPSLGWCEEGLIYQSSDVYLSRRVWPETLSKLSALVAWGERSKEDLNVVARPLGLHAQALGNPRFDLLRCGLRGFYDPQVNRIKEKIGDIILVNTNFSSVNPAPECAGRTKPVDPKSDGSHTQSAEKFERFQGLRREVFDDFTAMVPDLAARFRDKVIVVRPHPAECPKIWERVAQNQKNILVTREGPVVPWILASKALIHNGCTTAVEAALMDRCPIAYCQATESGLEAILANDISRRTTSLDELAVTVEMSMAGNLALDGAQQSLLDHCVSSRHGPLASERILQLCDDAAGSTCGGTGNARLGAKTFAVARYGYKAMRPNHRSDRYMPIVFPDTGTEYVEHRCAAMASCLNLPRDTVRVRSLGPNIFEMAAG